MLKEQSSVISGGLPGHSESLGNIHFRLKQGRSQPSNERDFQVPFYFKIGPGAKWPGNDLSTTQK